jgi:hypothetical protein
LTHLEQPYFDITSASYQQKVGGKTLLTLDFLARDEHHGLVYETLSPEQIGSELELATSRRDKYRGVTVSARHTFRNTAELFGSYTRSRASSDQVLDPVLGVLNFAPQQAGPLLWDAPNRLLSWANIPTPIWGILFSYMFNYQTGYPYSEVNPQQFLAAAPNTLRFPNYTSLIVGLEKKFTFRNRVFAARLTVVNVFDRQNPLAVVNDIAAPNFRSFAGGQGRAITGRLRFVGRK